MYVYTSPYTFTYPVSSVIAVTCGLAPIPEFGLIIYEKKVRGSTTDYGTIGTYKCLPPHVVIGNARAECTASGTWTKTPTCQGMKPRTRGNSRSDWHTFAYSSIATNW